MPEKLFEGIITPLLLPLDEEERIIEPDLETLTRELLTRGIKGFLVPSGTGEFYNLAFEERRRATETVVRVAKGRALIIAMISDCGTRNALRHIAAAREAGADAVMACAPYYVHIDQCGLKTFFTRLAEEGGLPLWLYHQPFHTKIQIDPETISALAENSNIVGVKASAGMDIVYFHRLLRAVRHRPAFRVLMGEDINAVSGLILGGHGMISTLSNLIPDQFLDVWEALKRGDLDRARRIQDHIADVEELVIPGWNSSWESAAKYILKRRGVFSNSIVSSPLSTVTESYIEKLESRGRELGLL
ncbi:MAG: dihydrodipicolinate synthase family protein [Terriglobales bacterium]